MNIFYGAYGFDILSIFMLLIISLLGFNSYTRILGMVLLILVIYRTFSKNIYKRTAELNKFIDIINKLLSKFGKRMPYNLPRIGLDSIPMLFNRLKYKIDQKIKFKIVKCPNCGQKLRLPRGKKHIIVTCRRCSNEFRIKT